MTHVINQGMSMYWGTSRWSAMEIMVSDGKSLCASRNKQHEMKTNFAKKKFIRQAVKKVGSIYGLAIY